VVATLHLLAALPILLGLAQSPAQSDSLACDQVTGQLGARLDAQLTRVHLRTVVPEGTTVPIGWVTVGDPASIPPPGDHERIWTIQQPLDLPATVYGLQRDPGGGVNMRELTRRLVDATARHRGMQSD
jgi:hypothetical protein